jgi:ABC-type multidrug transport system permease subunit
MTGVWNHMNRVHGRTFKLAALIFLTPLVVVVVAVAAAAAAAAAASQSIVYAVS